MRAMIGRLFTVVVWLLLATSVRAVGYRLICWS